VSSRKRHWNSYALLLALLLPNASPADESARELNGFRLENATIPVESILRGGPARDGIPALDHPPALPAYAAPWHPDETVIGVVRGGAARAYPIAILNWHELVNDSLGGSPLLVSYCPLCGTGMVFDRMLDGQVRSFGVSGLLYNSDLLLYDRESESLWSQIESTAVTGPASGTRLRVLRSELTTWARWKRAHPETTVLSLETGHERDYGRSPYQGYPDSDALYFPAPLDKRYHPKMPTLGVRLVSGAARGYPAAELVNAGGRVEERFEGRRIVVRYDPDDQVFEVEADDDLEVIEGYWFAWSAFHPEASVFAALGETDAQRSSEEED
jgi:hypothetical protein